MGGGDELEPLDRRRPSGPEPVAKLARLERPAERRRDRVPLRPPVLEAPGEPAGHATGRRAAGDAAGTDHPGADAWNRVVSVLVDHRERRVHLPLGLFGATLPTNSGKLWFTDSGGFRGG